MNLIKNRYNILKIILVLPVIIFHSFISFYGWDEARNRENYPSWNSIYNSIGNSFFSHFGTYLLVLSFFLVGLNFQDKQVKKPTAKWKTYLKLATLFLCFLGTQFDLTVALDAEGFFIWDLYSFILTAYLLVFFFGKYIYQNLKLSTLGFALLFWVTPFLQNALGGRLVASVDQIFFPTMLKTGANAWFLLPWIFLPLLAFCLGCLSQKNEFRKALVALVPPLAVALVVIAFVPITFYPFQVDSNLFYLNVFWQNSNFNILLIFPYLIFLVLFNHRVFQSLDSSPALHWVSKLQWCKNFWFSFILHFGFIDMMTTYYDVLFKNEIIFNYSWLIVFLGTELLMQLLMVALKFYAWIFRMLIPKLRLRS